MRATPAARILLLGLLLPGLPQGARAGVFLSPGLEARVGYTSNRFLESEARSSAFSALTPSLELTGFSARGAEIFGGLRYRRVDYLEADFGHVQDSVVETGATFPRGRWTNTLVLAGGSYRDQALPEDDLRWVALSPSLSWVTEDGVSLYLGGSGTVSRYTSRETSDGDRQEDFCGELHPGVLWVPTESWRVWLEGSVERRWSNEAEEEYAGGGGAAGFDAALGSRGRGGCWVRYNMRRYLEGTAPDGESRRDTPISAGAWATVRLAPWAELTAEASHVRYGSTADGSDYNAWNVEGGIRFVYDAEVGSL